MQAREEIMDESAGVRAILKGLEGAGSGADETRVEFGQAAFSLM